MGDRVQGGCWCMQCTLERGVHGTAPSHDSRPALLEVILPLRLRGLLFHPVRPPCHLRWSHGCDHTIDPSLVLITHHQNYERCQDGVTEKGPCAWCLSAWLDTDTRKTIQNVVFRGCLGLREHPDVFISPREKKICDIISKTELAWTHQMIMKKQCYISDGLIAALSLALAPPSTLRIPSLAFPNLFEVSGSPGLRKVTQSTEVQEDKAVTLCPQPWCISKQKGKQKKRS